MTCGCHVPAFSGSIHYCPLHEAAPDLLAALQEVIVLAQKAHVAWDSDQDSRVGKILMALTGRLPGYMAEVDALHDLVGRLRPKPPEIVVTEFTRTDA